ncbi:hypothetical protein EV578_102379 [Streptomyces sp. BK205]|nr:hypothetical protein EV578_102379 [Streptomyces sp. BK205]
MLSLLNPVVGLLMLRGAAAEDESRTGSGGRTGARVRCHGDRLPRPAVRSGSYGGCWYRSRVGAVTQPHSTQAHLAPPHWAQPHWAPVGQKELSALVSGSRTWAGDRVAGPLARIAYSVPSAASKRWSTT